MFNRFLISKKLLGKVKVKQKNPLALSCEKVTEAPRTYGTAQIKSATENILFVDNEENILPEIAIKSIEYLLKDLFIQMHQTGLYMYDPTTKQTITMRDNLDWTKPCDQTPR